MSAVPPDEAARRRRAALLLGDMLPETTSDERDPVDASGGRPARTSSRDEDLLRDVPPHHGG